VRFNANNHEHFNVAGMPWYTGYNMKLSEELKWRGFVNQTTLGSLAKLDGEKWIFYHGLDASADSLTIGNLAAVMMDKVFLRHGNKGILLAGGATSLIGDPGGKDSERPLQDEDTIKNNIRKVQDQIESLLGDKVHMVNNLDWFKNMNVLEFLRDVGKHFSMTPLVQRDYIATRMGPDGAGITYTELSYTLLQGYDFLHLYRTYGVELQLAGSDQWGNSLSGVELVRRVEGKEVHVFSCPLIINKATGKKFGKSEAGAVWLDDKKTSAYQFYQFWLNADDEIVESYLKIFTELDKPAIDKVMDEFASNKGGRAAQKKLAYEVTKLVHGKQRTDAVKRATEVLFGEGEFLSLSKEEIAILKEELVAVAAQPSLAQTIVKAGLASSNTEANRFITSGGIYINGEKAQEDNAFKQGANLLKRGKNSFAIVEKK
jgi:tyrosyl-tRNA synthetase